MRNKSPLLGSAEIPNTPATTNPTEPPRAHGGARPGAGRPKEAVVRDKHGDRSVPPPAEFDFEALPGSALLTQREVAAIGRWAVSTLERWRTRAHSLKWVVLPGGHIRYQVRDVREYLAHGQPRPRGRPRKAPAVPPQRRVRRAEGRPRSAASAPTPEQP